MKTLLLSSLLNLVLFLNAFCYSSVEVPGTPGTNRNNSLSKFEVVAEIDRTLSDMSSRELFSGTVLISKEGESIFKKAYGFSDKRTMSPNNTETKFNLGSINKLFTNVAILQLADQGKLALDDKLIKYLPEMPLNGISNIVTIRQLLEMTSGLGNIQTANADMKAKQDLKELKDYVRFFDEAKLDFTPGSGKQYSNAGYILLGLVIEELTGMSYHSYVKEYIFLPIGMKNTDFYTVDQNVPNLAMGCTGVRDNWKKCESNLPMLPYRGNSAEGGYSTVEDMALFVSALQNGRLLSPVYSAYALTQKMPDKAPSLPIRSGQLNIHGGAPGVNCCLNFNAENSELIIVLGNFDPPVATGAFKKIQDCLKHLDTNQTI